MTPEQVRLVVRLALAGEHEFQGACPENDAPDQRDPLCAQCRELLRLELSPEAFAEMERLRAEDRAAAARVFAMQEDESAHSDAGYDAALARRDAACNALYSHLETTSKPEDA